MQAHVPTSKTLNPAGGGKEALARGADYPAFREELVATLLETLAAHPRAAAARGAALPASSDGVHGDADELAAAVAAAAGAQAAAELAEWLGCAKIALQARRVPDSGELVCVCMCKEAGAVHAQAAVSIALA